MRIAFTPLISKTHTHTPKMAPPIALPLPRPPPAITSVRKLANLSSIPSNYAHNAETEASEPGDSIPVVDLSLLASGHAGALEDLDKACREWGFFMIVNHGIPGELVKGVLDATREFFELPEEEKPEFQPKDVLTPVRYGTSFNTEKEEVFCWRDFLKVFVHPEFNCPARPESLRKLVIEYSERCREVTRRLLIGVSKSLGLEEGEAEAALGMASTLQIFIANLYPRCPEPEAAMGMPPHSDHGLFTLLIENGVGGLQIQHGGRWINVKAQPNSILVNTGDHLEIFSNGKYKSVVHRVVVNGEKARISVAMANGPSRDAVVEAQGCAPPAYAPVKYGDYILAQQSNQLNGKSILKSFSIED